MEVNIKNCSERTELQYPSGAYQLSKAMLERLEDIKMNGLHELRLLSSQLIVFDFEPITVPNNKQKHKINFVDRKTCFY